MTNTFIPMGTRSLKPDSWGKGYEGRKFPRFRCLDSVAYLAKPTAPVCLSARSKETVILTFLSQRLGSR